MTQLRLRAISPGSGWRQSERWQQVDASLALTGLRSPLNTQARSTRHSCGQSPSLVDDERLLGAGAVCVIPPGGTSARRLSWLTWASFVGMEHADLG